ncbi:MAG: hypothetical protein LBK02_05720 [Treponema sp.]|nr:hypothetical protein [Treponema sp.]
MNGQTPGNSLGRLSHNFDSGKDHGRVERVKEFFMKLNFRIIGKFCFLLVIIGFFMPVACDANGFQIAHSSYAESALSMALYGLFISAIIGLVIGVVLLIKKNIPVVIDWLVVLACMCCGLIPFFMNVRNYQFQSGMYVILAGYVLIFVAQVVSLIRKET